MTPETFRGLALGLPEVVEWLHHGKPDFRVGGRIFATLGYPDACWGLVCLSPGEQATMLEAEPAAFQSSLGHWGRNGSTQVWLEAADAVTLGSALRMAWRGRAGKRLLAHHAALVAA